jgi:hypothetical protein
LGDRRVVPIFCPVRDPLLKLILGRQKIPIMTGHIGVKTAYNIVKAVYTRFPFQKSGILEGVDYSIASFRYALTRLRKRNTDVTFTVLAKTNSRRHSHANIEKFGSELY